MAGLDEGQPELPQPIVFEGKNVYLLNDLITFDRPFFVGCIDKPRKTIKKKNIPMTSTGSLHTAKETIHGLRQPPKTIKPRSSYVRTGFTTTYPNLLDTRALTSTNLYHLC